MIRDLDCVFLILIVVFDVNEDIIFIVIDEVFKRDVFVIIDLEGLKNIIVSYVIG